MRPGLEGGRVCLRDRLSDVRASVHSRTPQTSSHLISSSPQSETLARHAQIACHCGNSRLKSNQHIYRLPMSRYKDSRSGIGSNTPVLSADESQQPQPLSEDISEEV